MGTVIPTNVTGVSEMTVNLRDTIFAADDIESEVVHVDGWGVDVEVHGMSGKARANFLPNYSDADGNVDWANVYPTLLIQCVHDPESHELIFSVGDEDALNSKSGSSLELVAKAALRLSGMDNESEVEAGKS